MSILVNLFHTEHDPPDVIGLDNNTAMLFIRDFFYLLYQKSKILSHTRFYNAAASYLSRSRRSQVTFGRSLVLRFSQQIFDETRDCLQSRKRGTRNKEVTILPTLCFSFETQQGL